MKYRIVYPSGFSSSACYLVGHHEDGRPLYRYYSTKKPKRWTTKEKAEILGILSSVVSFGQNRS